MAVKRITATVNTQEQVGIFSMVLFSESIVWIIIDISNLLKMRAVDWI